MEREIETPNISIIIIIISLFSLKQILSVVCGYPAQDFAQVKSRNHLLFD